MGRRVADADPSLKWRILSAVVLAPAVLALVIWGVWPFALLAAVAVVLLAMEWRHLMAARFNQRTGDLAGLAAGLCALLIVAMAAVGWYRPAISTIAICLGIAGIAAPMLKILPTWPFVGIAYLSLPMLAMIWLRGLPEIGLAILLWLLLVVWATDIMAYVFGRWIGGRRLAPSISPGKTWAGLWGGMAGAALVGALAAFLIGPFRPLPSIALAAGLAGVAQLGDLAESALKRQAGVKDSGGLIPGHGGLFDRLDGLLFAAPVLALVALLAGRQGWP
ncbi:MAG: phosphatidate cytidylyltransferase [Alphaproteobacteria bacterium]|nr:phosphatidate cytidylyltransferase [Alphaproteobacteria bacterium]